MAASVAYVGVSCQSRELQARDGILRCRFPGSGPYEQGHHLLRRFMIHVSTKSLYRPYMYI